MLGHRKELLQIWMFFFCCCCCFFFFFVVVLFVFVVVVVFCVVVVFVVFFKENPTIQYETSRMHTVDKTDESYYVAGISYFSNYFCLELIIHTGDELVKILNLTP